MNIILFGGAFDPFHEGHLLMMEEALKSIGGKGILIPAKISVWKREATPANVKIDLIKLAIKDRKDIEISTFEIDNNCDTTYSIDTVKHFKKLYPKDNLYYLIGLDQVNSFHLWKSAEEISQLVQLVYFTRPEIVENTFNINKYHIQRIESNFSSKASSTEIRKFQNLYLNYDQIKYIEENSLYYIPKIRSYLSLKRFNHSKEVANLAYKIAESNNYSHPEYAYIAGLLHDIGKEVSLDKTLSIMNDNYNEYKDLPLSIIHQFVGAHIAKNDFCIDKEEIIQAIEFHASGKANMTRLGKIIYASDKIEPTRGFDSSDLIKAMLEDDEKGFVSVLKANIEFLESKKLNYNNFLTKNCIDYYIM